VFTAANAERTQPLSVRQTQKSRIRIRGFGSLEIERLVVY
jgi:hypothetical protein